MERGRHPFGRIAAGALGLPTAGEHGLRLSIAADGRGRERWSRTFGGREMSSTQERGTGRAAGLVTERIGPVALHLALSRDGDRLRYRSAGWSVFGIPLPGALAPRGDVHEFVDGRGRFGFHVDLRVPGLGRLVRYRGWLRPSRGRCSADCGDGEAIPTA